MPVAIAVPPKEKVAQALLEGKSKAMAAKILGVHIDTLDKWYELYFGNMPPYEVRKPSKDELLTSYRNEGKGATMKKYGVSATVLGQWLDEYQIIHDASPGYVKLSEAARRMGVSKMALSVRYRKGQLPGAIKIGPQTVVVPISTVENVDGLYDVICESMHYNQRRKFYRLKGQSEDVDE